MKKSLLLVSCLAVVLILSKVSFAQQALVVDPTTCPCEVASTVALPLAYPGLSVNPRDVRRIVRLEGRMALRHARTEARHAMPALQPYPFVGGVGAEVQEGFGPWSDYGPVAQTGRRNYSVQRTGGVGSSVNFNFLSAVRTQTQRGVGVAPGQ